MARAALWPAFGSSAAVSRRGAESRGYVVGTAISSCFRASRRPLAAPMTSTVYAASRKLKNSSRAGLVRFCSCRRGVATQSEQRVLDTLLRERRARRQCPGVGTVPHRKIAQSQAEPLRVLLCTCEKTRRALLRAARPRRAAAEPCRQAIGSHSSLRRPWRRRPASCARRPADARQDHFH